MNAMVPGLTGAKMSSSEVDSKIDLLDSRDSVQRKLALALCPPNMTAEQGNGLLAFLKYVALPLAMNEEPGELHSDHTVLVFDLFVALANNLIMLLLVFLVYLISLMYMLHRSASKNEISRDVHNALFSSLVFRTCKIKCLCFLGRKADYAGYFTNGPNGASSVGFLLSLA